jgi:hypothetical protein
VDQRDVELRRELLCDGVGHRHAAARYGHDQRSLLGEAAELLSQYQPGMAAISIQHVERRSLEGCGLHGRGPQHETCRLLHRRRLLTKAQNLRDAW